MYEVWMLTDKYLHPVFHPYFCQSIRIDCCAGKSGKISEFLNTCIFALSVVRVILTPDPCDGYFFPQHNRMHRLLFLLSSFLAFAVAKVSNSDFAKENSQWAVLDKFCFDRDGGVR